MSSISNGGLLLEVTEPGIGLHTFGCCPGPSSAQGLTELGGHIYVAGYSRLFGHWEDNVDRPVLMKYDSSLSRIWKRRPLDSPGLFRAVASDGTHLYVAGYTLPSPNDYLIEKYDQSGNRLWRAVSGGGSDDVLTGVVAFGNRIFAVGYTFSTGAGGADTVVLEIDPLTGMTLSQTLFGGTQNDFANGAATDGVDLYVVGESRSFASGDGNVVGQNDVMLLHYSTVITVDIDIKPGSFPNSINPRSRGVIPVAILTTATFDATTVDPMSVEFGPSGASETHGTGHIEDADGDGDDDLVLHFRTQDTGIQCADTSASLMGQTFGGQSILGSDSINTVGCN